MNPGHGIVKGYTDGGDVICRTVKVHQVSPVCVVGIGGLKIPEQGDKDPAIPVVLHELPLFLVPHVFWQMKLFQTLTWGYSKIHSV